MKQYLRELPDTLFPSAFYDKLIQTSSIDLIKETSFLTVCTELDEEQWLAEFETILSNFPSVNLKVAILLKYCKLTGAGVTTFI